MIAVHLLNLHTTVLIEERREGVQLQTKPEDLPINNNIYFAFG